MPDTISLFRINDLIYQLGKTKYFSMLDLAVGYWQIQMHPDSVEKTAFVNDIGIYEFHVMHYAIWHTIYASCYSLPYATGVG